MNSYGKIKLYLSEFFLLLLLCTASVPVIHGQDQSLFNEIKKHTIQLTSYFSGEQENGFGFVVSEKSGFLYIVTARHLLFKYDDYERKYIKAESVKARFFEDMGVCYDNITILDIKMRELDLALIRLGKPGFGFEFSGGCFSSPVKRGDSVWFIGKGKNGIFR